MDLVAIIVFTYFNFIRLPNSSKAEIEPRPESGINQETMRVSGIQAFEPPLFSFNAQ